MNQTIDAVDVNFVSMDQALKQQQAWSNSRNIQTQEQLSTEHDTDTNDLENNVASQEQMDNFYIDEDGNRQNLESYEPDFYQDTYFRCIKRLIVNCFLGLIYNSFKSGIMRSDS